MHPHAELIATQAEDLGEAVVILVELACRRKYSFDRAYKIMIVNHNISISRNSAYEIKNKNPEHISYLIFNLTRTVLHRMNP